MQDIIRKIIEIDKMAQKLSDETNEIRQQKEAELESDKRRMREDYLSQARSRIELNAKTEEEFLQKSMAEIAQRREQIEGELRGLYEERHTQWVDEIYNRVIGR